MKIELVVCDLAGTTIKDNRDVHKALQRAFAGFGIAITLDDANEVMGLPKPVAIRQLLEMKGKVRKATDRFIARVHEEFMCEMIWFYETDEEFSEKEGVSDTFKKLKQNGIKVVVDTGFDRKITNTILRRTGWLGNGLIDASVSSDEVAQGRPYPDLIFKAMKLTGVEKAETVVKVGDTRSDLIEGTSAGCGMVIGVTTGAFSKEVLQQEKHSHLISQIPELMPILGLA